MPVRAIASRRNLVTASCALVLAFAAYGRARALVEYCPASIDRGHRVGAAIGTPTTIWAYTLSALGPRVVSGTILAQTSDGWFSIPFSNVTLAGQDVHYTSPYVTFTRQEFESAPLYARFPMAVGVERWWIDSVSVTGDTLFDWNGKGVVRCLPEPDTTGVGPGSAPLAKRATPDVDLSLPPPAGTPIAAALLTAAPPGLTACATPFSPASVTERMDAEYPNGYDVNTEAAVLVAIGANSVVDDAWIYYPSGIKAFDDAALRAARDSRYAAGTALCQPAPGEYLFVVTFESTP